MLDPFDSSTNDPVTSVYSALLRDLFMWLTIRMVFQPKWTERIHGEWIENLLENRPHLTRVRVVRTRDLMNRWGRDWKVPEHETLIPTLHLPDEDDRHVLAAALAAEASVIVTFNQYLRQKTNEEGRK